MMFEKFIIAILGILLGGLLTFQWVSSELKPVLDKQKQCEADLPRDQHCNLLFVKPEGK